MESNLTEQFPPIHGTRRLPSLAGHSEIFLRTTLGLFYRTVFIGQSLPLWVIAMPISVTKNTTSLTASLIDLRPELEMIHPELQRKYL